MPGPFNYLEAFGGPEMLDVSGSVRRAIFGEQQRQQNELVLEQQRLANEQAQREALQAQQLQADAGDLIDNLTPDNLNRFMVKYPKLHEGISQVFNNLKSEQQESTIRQMADVTGYIDSAFLPGTSEQQKQAAIEGAVAALQAQKDAAAKVGMDDGHYDKLMELVRTNLPGARLMAHVAMATALGKERYADAYRAQRDQARDDELQPAKLRKAEADADKADADAEIAETDSAWREVQNAAGVTLQQARAADIRSLIAKRAAALRKPPEQVTVAEVTDHLTRKRSKAGGLSRVERDAHDLLTRSGRFDPKAPTATDPKTGRRVRFNRTSGKWEPMK